MPLITVLLPVYNAEKYLEESLESLEGQTFKDFKVLILEDGCTDKSEEIALKFQEKDKRFLWIERKENLGITKTLNQGLKLADGQYIARMDADDISLPQRFEKQIELMQENPEIVSCGTQIQCFDEKGNLTFFELPTAPNDIFAEWIYRPALVHPTSFTKRKVFQELKYDERFLYGQDYHLWSRILLKGKLANLDEVLYKLRIHKHSISAKHNIIQKENAKKTFKLWLSAMDIEPTDMELELNRPIFTFNVEIEISNVRKVENWLQKLYVQNQKTKVFPEPNFTNLLRRTWAKYTLDFSSLGLPLWSIWKNSPLSEGLLTNFQRQKFWLKCLLNR